MLSKLGKETYRVELITREELIKAINMVKPATSPEDLKNTRNGPSNTQYYKIGGIQSI